VIADQYAPAGAFACQLGLVHSRRRSRGVDTNGVIFARIACTELPET
jgi:hypothetical protein